MNRINFLDYTKAIAIFFIISVHIGFYQLNNVLLFFMPAFFIVSGYSFNPDKRSAKESIKLRFKALMIPFFGFMIFYALIEPVRASLFGYANWDIMLPALSNTVYGSGYLPIGGEIGEYFKEILAYKAQPDTSVDAITPTNCHLWFLPATFVGYVVLVLLAKKTRKSHLIKALSLILLVAFASLEVVFPLIHQLPYGMGRGALAGAFMLVGFWIKECGFFEKKSIVLHAASSVICALVAVTAILLGSDGSAMVRSYYGPYGALSVLITFVGGIAAALVVFELCRVIDNLPVGVAKKFLSFVGQNVLIFYLIHMAVKFLPDLVYVLLIHGADTNLLDEYNMGLLPETSALYMLFEIIFVITVCSFIAVLKNKIQKKRNSASNVG